MKNLQKGKKNAEKLHSRQKAAIAIIAIPAVALSVWYHIPLKKHTTIMVFNLKDNANYVNVNLDSVISRSFVFPTQVRGEIQFEDVTYIPWVNDELGFLQRISKRFKGEIITPVWINSSNIGYIGNGAPLEIDHDKMLSDLIYIQHLEFNSDYSIKMISLIKTSGGSSIWSSCD